MQPLWNREPSVAAEPRPHCKAGLSEAQRERTADFVVARGGTLTPYSPAPDAPALSAERYRSTLRFRGLLLAEGAPQAMRRHPECRECAQIHACPAVFLDEPRPPLDAAAPALVPDVRAYPVVLDLSRLGNLTALDQLIHWIDTTALSDEAAHRTAERHVAVRGRVECVRLDRDRARARLEPGTIEPHAITDRAVGHNVRVSSSDLPARTGRPDFLVGLAPSLGTFRHIRGKIATLFILRRCTANCVMCHVQEFYVGADMPIWRVYEQLEELRMLGFDRIDFFGGEPTLRPDLAEMISLARSFDCEVDIITNGMSIDTTLARKLRLAGLNLAMVSLDGPTSDAHDKIRGVPHGFERATRGIRELVGVAPPLGPGDIGMAVNVDTVVLPENFDVIERQVELVAALGATHVNFFLCVSAPLLAHKDMWLDRASAERLFRDIVPRCREKARELGITLSISPDVATDEPGAMDRFLDAVSRGVYNPLYLDGRRCAAAFDEVYVTLAGDVFPCTSPTLLETEHKIGNAFERPIAEIVGGEAHRKFAEVAGSVEACRMCWRSHNELRDHALSRPWIPASRLARQPMPPQPGALKVMQ